VEGGQSEGIDADEIIKFEEGSRDIDAETRKQKERVDSQETIRGAQCIYEEI
jgi:hypothetical protein